VLGALASVREASRPDVNLVIVASRVTDLVPILDEVYSFRGVDPQRYAAIETVSTRRNQPGFGERQRCRDANLTLAAPEEERGGFQVPAVTSWPATTA
jgi:hypothetical protein